MDAEKPRELVSNAEVFLEEVHRAFVAAQERCGGSEDHFYNIAGRSIHLRFAGPALVPSITPAFAHLRTAPCPAPDLTICLWDSASTRTKLPPLPWSADAYEPRCLIRGYNDARFGTAFNPGEHVLSLLDAQENLAIQWFPDADRVPQYERGSPLLSLLHWWMGRHGRRLVHAGAVGTESGGVLLAGKGGSGKSSTCLLALDSSLRYAADDYCLLSSDPEPHVFSLYSSGKVHGKDAHRFPFLTAALSNADQLAQEKALYFFAPLYANRITAGFPLRAILLPQVIGGKETRVRKVSAAAALLALAPSTIFQLAGAGQEAMTTLTEIVRKVPSYALELGADRRAILPAIERLLASLYGGKGPDKLA